tara:strand:+ start:1043 stop:1270 length:228 start_codon:yes stop_codon:yes gene_type:complete
MTDQTKRIVFMNDEGRVSIIAPAPDCDLSIEDLAKKDVPKGKKFKIINTTDVSSDRSFRNAWTVDESDLTDGVGE